MKKENIALLIFIITLGIVDTVCTFIIINLEYMFFAKYLLFMGLTYFNILAVAIFVKILQHIGRK